jgi:hypothetical protein
MFRFTKLLPLLAAFLLMIGCVSVPSSQDLATANYGPPPGADYRQQIKDWMLGVLKDPMSAQYQFTQPIKGYMNDAPISGGRAHFGWTVEVKINSKNSFGGYVGFTPYKFLFKKGKLIEAVDLNTGLGFTSAGGASFAAPPGS